MSRVVGGDETRLVVVRGPSGSGKSTVARALRRRMGRRTALVEQDYLRRILMWEKDTAGGSNIGMIDSVARHALDAGYSVVLEGILAAERYGTMLTQLIDDHAGITVCAYLDASFDETVRRHATRTQAAEFTVEQMMGWFQRDDRLGVHGEIVIPQQSTIEETVTTLFEAQRGTRPEPRIEDADGASSLS